ncbi:MAG TPA: MFS transporter [Candidatus Angelobacter sp.]|nr:MFS transporter [Candidatus Angelobacter sp.]
MSGTGVGLRDVLRVRGFRLLLASRLAGQTGDGLLQASLATFVLFSPERQPTAAKVAVAFAVLLLPYSLIGPFVGVLLDRWRRRDVLVYANLLRGVLVVGLAVVVAAGHDDALLAVWVLVVLGVNRFILAALSAGLPHVVADRYLVTGNALAPTAGTVASVVGGVAGVAIRGLAGGGDHGSVVVLGVAVLIYLLASGVASRLAPAQLGPDESTVRETFRGVAVGMVDGVRHLSERRPAARAIGLVMVHRVIFGIVIAVTVLQVRGVLHPASPNDAVYSLTLVTGAAGIGAFLGAVVTPRMSRRLGAVRWSSLALVSGVAVGSAGLAVATLPGLLVEGLFVGFAGQAVKVCSDTIVQEDVDDDRRGRVFALYDVAVNVAIVTGLTAAAFTAPPDGNVPSAAVWMVALAVVGAWWALTAERRDPAASYAADPAAVSSADDLP